MTDAEARDKRLSAAHEAAHLTVALAENVTAEAYIERTDTTDPIHNKHWIGRCTYKFGGTPSPAVCAAA